jgi:EAL domain-containing protein (putative c-di-GMP-specific phosphodiesterase class I)
MFPEDGQDIETLLRSADKALSSAKSAGRNVQIAYDQQEHERSSDTLHLESDLRTALQQDELALHFQPKFDLRSGALLGAEALLRWDHPEHGMISPGTFIPMAEETGLIVDIDRWVMDRTCRHIRNWRDCGLAQLAVSINLSGREFNFDRPELTLARILDANGIDPSLIELEITETVLMADPSAAAAKLAELKAMGIRLAVDDFGTGYSSLGYLKRFPLDVLKIDREFVKDLDHDENDRTLCRAMISMARGLGLEVVAEGIETREQHDFLRFEGCQIGQGFLLARPLPVEDYEAMLTENSPVKASADQQPYRTSQSTWH